MAYRQKDERQPSYGRDPQLDPGLAVYVAPDEPQIDIRELLRVFRRRRKLMARALITVLLVGIAYTLIQKPLYESRAIVLVPSSKANPLVGLAAANSFLSDIQSLLGGSSQETVAALMSEEHFLDDVFDSLSPSSRRKGFGNAEEIPKWAIAIEPKRNTDVIEVGAFSHDAHTSAALADCVIKEYIRRDKERSRTAVEDSRSYAREKMQMLGRQLRQANAELARFKRENSLVAPDKQLEKVAEYVAALELDRENARASLAAAKSGMEAIGKELAGQETTVISSSVVTQNPRLADALKSIDDLSRKRIELLQEYTPEAPEIKSLDEQISRSQAALKNLAENVVESRVESRNPLREELIAKYSEGIATEAAYRARIAAIDAGLERKHRESLSLPEKERQLTELMQEAEVLKRTYAAMSERYYMLLLGERTGPASAQVVSWARVERLPVNRKLIRNAVASLVLGALAAVLLALGVERFDKRVKDQRTAESVSGYLTSAVVPDLGPDTAPVIKGSDGSAPLLESFRVLRNSIYLAGAQTSLKTIAVTSVTPKEGKSVTCINLANVMAMDGRKVLLVDCNVHNPSIGRMMEMPYGAGLTNVLTGACGLEEAIAPADLDSPHFLTTGPLVLNFPELLNAQSSKAVFAELSEKYDTVLIDCPPISCFSDIQAVSSLADAFLLVVALDRTEEEALAAAVRKLESLNCPVLSLVLREGDYAFPVEGNGDARLSPARSRSDASREPGKVNASKRPRPQG